MDRRRPTPLISSATTASQARRRAYSWAPVLPDLTAAEAPHGPDRHGGKPQTYAPGLRRSHHRRDSRSRPSAKAVGGFDLTFSPSKSVSVAWALGDRKTRDVIYSAISERSRMSSHTPSATSFAPVPEREAVWRRKSSASSRRTSPTSTREMVTPNSTITS